MSLYRKYRPQTFADVYGQDHVITTLEQSAEQNKLAHAYLFAGSRGTGKTSVARILAKVLMINGIEDEVLERQIMSGVEDGSIVDLLEIDAASNRGIDDVRDLIEKIQFSPVVAAAKVYIIDEVHMLTKEAFNALLKTLEEPPAYAYFILATTELNKIPTTIQSRCQCFPFRRIREEDIVRRLQFIADQEKISIDREALRAIAHHVDGGMRDAISLLDQLRSLPKIGLTDVEQRIGTTGQEYIEAVFTAIENSDHQTLIENVKKIEEAGIPLDIFVRQMLSIVRRSMHDAIANEQDAGSYVQMLQVLLRAIRDIRTAPVPGLILEATLLQLCKGHVEPTETPGLTFPSFTKKEPKAEAPAAELPAQQHEAVEQPKKESTEATEKPTIIEAPEFTVENVRKHWAEISQKASPASVKMSLKNGLVAGVKEDKVIISFSSSFHRDRVAGEDGSRSIEDTLLHIFKKKLRIECITESEKSQKVADEDIVNLAEAAAEIF